MISERIRLLREKSNMSQTELAKKLNITRSSVNAWELEISVPSTQYLIQLAKLFRVSTDYLLGISSEMQLNLAGYSDEELKIIYDIVNYFNNKKDNNHKK